jgi:hypothetical protein
LEAILNVSRTARSRKLTEAIDVLWDLGGESVPSEQVVEEGVQTVLDPGYRSAEDCLCLVKEVCWGLQATPTCVWHLQLRLQFALSRLNYSMRLRHTIDVYASNTPSGVISLAVACCSILRQPRVVFAVHAKRRSVESTLDRADSCLLKSLRGYSSESMLSMRESYLLHSQMRRAQVPARRQEPLRLPWLSVSLDVRCLQISA